MPDCPTCGYDAKDCGCYEAHTARYGGRIPHLHELDEPEEGRKQPKKPVKPPPSGEKLREAAAKYKAGG